MRKGVNPTKGGKLVNLEPCDHRILIPLHIPNEEGYFKDAYKIFLLCLNSLLKTSQSKLKISIISNKSSTIINQRLLKLYEEGVINELIIEKEGLGKINSLLKALRTTEERLVTITDADVLFLNNWESEVVSVFKSFPKAGAVSPVPVFRKHLDLTSNIWLDHLFNNKIKFQPVKDRPALEKFVQSIGWQYLPEDYGDTIGTITQNNTTAVLGCPHFVATYKSEVFKEMPKTNTPYLIDGDSELKYLDLPTIKMDGYRLSTNTNNAYHLGNVFEDWMQDAFDNLKEINKLEINYNELKDLKPKKIKYLVSEKIFKRLIKKRSFLKFLLRKKGLTHKQVQVFVKR